jgi:hypothetical protein
MVEQTKLAFNAYTLYERFTGSCYAIPKALFYGDYRVLSSDAKLLYGVILDRLEESRARVERGDKQWINSNGEIFIMFDRDAICELLDISPGTLKRVLVNLANLGLVYWVRRGPKAGFIFIGKINDSEMMVKIDPSFKS